MLYLFKPFSYRLKWAIATTFNIHLGENDTPPLSFNHLYIKFSTGICDDFICCTHKRHERHV